MAQNRLFIDYDLCFGCHACEVACKIENSLPVGTWWIRVHVIGPRAVDGRLRMDFVPVTCRHCVEPLCLGACPQKAIHKRLDGAVLISREDCIGCLACFEACPFGALDFSDRDGKAQKCTMCAHRISQGKPPACAQTCPAGAIFYSSAEDITKQKQHRHALHSANRRMLKPLR